MGGDADTGGGWVCGVSCYELRFMGGEEVVYLEKKGCGVAGRCGGCGWRIKPGRFLVSASGNL